MMQASERALALIRQCEGFTPKPKPDAGGRMQIGYGHDILPGELFSDVSAEQAETLLAADVKCIEAAINRLVTVALSQNQFDALVDLIYNIGTQAFEKSTLLILLNEGDMAEAAEQFGRWVYGGGEVMSGLTTRRALEKALFCKAI
ncbi:MAG: lysozyme [Pseudomonadota bacterium]|nr:lysozyme [Pseudomonadota bacterium]MDE3037120.1 lysozyme [Pseudomonadota bacterium]